MTGHKENELLRDILLDAAAEEFAPEFSSTEQVETSLKFQKSISGLTTIAVDGGRKEILFRFLWICGISNTRIQRSLFSVDSIVYPLIQSVADGDDLRDGHIRVLSPPAKAFPASS